MQILNVKEFLKKFERFLISYVKSVNEVYGRVGHLFQGRFQSKPVESEEYLLHLSRYIHLNPVFAGLVKEARDWEFSSYRDYIGTSQKSKLIQTHFVLSHFGNIEEYRVFVESFGAEEMHRIEEALWK